MRVEDLQWLQVKDTGPYFRNSAVQDVPVRVADRLRGILQDVNQILARRDDGTMHRFQTYPIRPNTHKAITGAVPVGGGSLVIRLTVVGHAYNDNDVVYIDEVTGTTEANGRWSILVDDVDHILLVDSVFVNAYVSGGIITKTPITLIKMFPLYDENAGQEYTIVVGLDAVNYTHVYVYDATLAAANPGSQGNWIEITRTFTALVNGTPAAGDTTATIDNLKDSRAYAYVPVSTELVGYGVINIQRNNAGYVSAMPSATQITLNTAVGSDALAWQDNDELMFFRDNGFFQQLFQNPFTFTYANCNLNLGATPYMRWNDITGQQKVNWYAGTAGAPPVMRYPLRIQRNSTARDRFYAAAGKLITLPANWYMEFGGGGLCPFYDSIGTSGVPVIPAQNAWTDVVKTIADVDGNVFMKITLSHQARNTGDANSNSPYIGQRFAFTLSYDGYQESDPILETYFQTTVGSEIQVGIKKIEICLARMNKAITGLNVYSAYGSVAQVTGGWPVADSEYFLVMNLPFDGPNFTQIGLEQPYIHGANNFEWAIQTTSEYEIYLFNSPMGTFTSFSGSFVQSLDNLADSIGHPALRELRSYLKPRFVRKAARSQGSLVVVDQDDRSLRLSTYCTIGGQLVHQDDNFPNVTADNKGNKQIITLIGKGPLQGIANHSNFVWCFRNSEFELQDLVSVNQELAPCDFYAIESLVVHDEGMTWVGKSGIYWVPNGSLQIVPVNPLWANELTGSVLIDDGSNSVITNASRLAARSGWNPYTREVWLQFLVNNDAADGGGTSYVQYILTKGMKAWRQRVVGVVSPATQEIHDYSQSKDGTFSLVYAGGVLKYPNLGALRYEDDVTNAGLSAGLGIDTSFEVNIPEVAGQYARSVLRAITPRFRGTSTDKNGKIKIEFFANRQAAAFDTQYFNVDEIADLREIADFGEMEALKTRVSIVDPANVQRLDFSQIDIGFRTKERRGSD